MSRWTEPGLSPEERERGGGDEMSENIDDATGCVHGLVWGCRDCMIDLLTRELDEARGLLEQAGNMLDFTPPQGVPDEVKRLLARATTAEARAREDGSKLLAIARKLGIYYSAEGRAEEPGPMDDLLCEVERLQAAEAMVCEQKDRIVALEAQLATRGACQCGDDEVCALARRAQEAERELDRVRERAIHSARRAALEEAAKCLEEEARHSEEIAEATIDYDVRKRFRTLAQYERMHARYLRALRAHTPAAIGEE